VTEQRRTEGALRVAQVREQRRRVSHQMLQVLMHEIRNPLTGILGNLQLLESEVVLPQIKHCHDEIKQCAKGIEAALKQLSKLDLENPAPVTGA
jgi:nitrogen-specific signal transduction histidine kinase